MAQIDKTQSGLEWLFAPLEEMDSFRDLEKTLGSKPGVYAVSGLDDTQRLHVLAGLARKTGRMLLLVTATDQLAQYAVDDLTTFLGGRVALFPARETSFQRTAAASSDLAVRRIEALGAAAAGGLRAMVAPVDALLYPLMPPSAFRKNVVLLKEGMQMEPIDLIARLTDAGYERVDVVEARGQCALRGGIVDLFPVGRASALRLEFFDDELDSLRDFDPLSQRSVSRVTGAVILPAHETLLTAEEANAAADRLQDALTRAMKKAGPSRQERIETLFDLPPWEEFSREADELDQLPSLDEMDPAPVESPLTTLARSELENQFLPRIEALRQTRTCAGAEALMPYLYEKTALVTDYLSNAIVVLDQPDRLKNRCENRLMEFEEQYKVALERECALPEQAALLSDYETLVRKLTSGTALILTPFLTGQTDIRAKAMFRFDSLSGSGYQGNMHELIREMKQWKKDGWRVAFMAGGAARGQRLSRTFEEAASPVPFMADSFSSLVPGQPVIVPGGIMRGFQYPALKLRVLSETDVYGTVRQKTRSSWKAGEKIAAFTDLAVGDYVVHETYGIGQYMGTERLQVGGAYGDYLYIRYHGTDKLYVPTDQLDRVQKYIGSEEAPPKINKLSGTEWQRQKAKVKAQIEEIAEDLVKLYAERHQTDGHAFSPDTPWQREFEDSFPYDETEDQLRAIEEIKRDMESPSVMDRLLCGDVGYGKTEVALRAIFKAVVDGKQAALLAPTTILAQQHYATILKRFAGFPVKVEVLSRFRTAAEQKLIIGAVKRGEVDIIVGTHRLLGKDVQYKDLGLLVVDEEQRFGVQHKEAIKQLKKNVDVLTLSATPIPRTLHMSMVGIRDMSLLRTPPEERYPIQTYVVEYSDGLIRDAILREMARDGQVYILYNRVQSIERFYERLRKLVPEARIAIGHGQMREHALEDVMLDFYEGKYDVLLCTTIIEAGLDVPAANTLIVMDADRFGLSQLYQIRGRVGRSNRLAYAYLTIQPGKVLTEQADKRLSAIREFTEFGAGFRIAMRDLEIRGTGNLLGSAQSGHMASVGYDLYVKMIDETVRKLRGDVSQGDIQTRVELRLDAYLPGDYVPNDKQRIDVYKKIAQIDGADSRSDLLEELIDRFGDPTRPVMNLIDIAHLKGLCGRIGVESIGLRQGKLMLKFAAAAQIDPIKLLPFLEKYRRFMTLAATTPPSLVLNFGPLATDDLVRKAIPLMEEVVPVIEPKQEGK